MENSKNTITDLHHARMTLARNTIREMQKTTMVKLNDINFINTTEEQIDFLQATACYLQDLAFRAASKLESIKQHNSEYTHSAASSLEVVECYFKATAKTITRMVKPPTRAPLAERESHHATQKSLYKQYHLLR